MNAIKGIVSGLKEKQSRSVCFRADNRTVFISPWLTYALYQGAFSKLQTYFSIFQVSRRTAGSCAWCQELLSASWEQQRCHDSHLRGQPTKGKGGHSGRELPHAFKNPMWRGKWRAVRIQGWTCRGFGWILPWTLLSIMISIEAVSARNCKEVNC